MLVVISDLHFEEENSDNIFGDGNKPSIIYSRNLPPKVFQSFVGHLANEAKRNEANRLDLVLAGDIFDIHRTSLWFHDNPDALRPYVNNNQVDSPLEAKILKILDSITKEKGVSDALKTICLLASGKFGSDGENKFPVPTKIHFLPGNHDRLANATPKIREVIRRLLGMESGSELFPHVLLFPREGSLIRHGHEYDIYNFSVNTNKMEMIPIHLPEESYAESPFGDYATVDIASFLPIVFRRHHGDDQILDNDNLRTTYLKLLEFDDLRPQSALLNFLIHQPRRQIDPMDVWRSIEPVLFDMLEILSNDNHLKSWLDRLDKKWQFDAIDVIQTTFGLKAWRLTGIPLGLSQFISNTTLEQVTGGDGPEVLAAKEKVVRDGDYQFIISGHTHRPATALIANDSRGERYYIDTGTWRNRIPATPDFKSFGRLKTLTYAIVYGPDEDIGEGRLTKKGISIDYWSGITQRWNQVD